MDFSSSSLFDQHKGKSCATNFKILWSSSVAHANVLRLFDRINNINFWQRLGLFWFYVKEFLPSVLDLDWYFSLLLQSFLKINFQQNSNSVWPFLWLALKDAYIYIYLFILYIGLLVVIDIKNHCSTSKLSSLKWSEKFKNSWFL